MAAKAVAVEALPVSAPVIVPAVKLPEPSRKTIRLAVLAAVALCGLVSAAWVSKFPCVVVAVVAVIVPPPEVVREPL